jgi:hypothetical protein
MSEMEVEAMTVTAAKVKVTTRVEYAGEVSEQTVTRPVERRRAFYMAGELAGFLPEPAAVGLFWPERGSALWRWGQQSEEEERA